MHAAKIQSNHATTIGANVSVGANAVVHACAIGDNVLVGDGAQVLDGATVMAWAVVAPGAVVGPGKVVGTGELWSGTPAKLLRMLTEAEKAAIPAAAQEAAMLAAIHQNECGKGYLEVLADIEDATDLEERHVDYFPRVSAIAQALGPRPNTYIDMLRARSLYGSRHKRSFKVLALLFTHQVDPALNDVPLIFGGNKAHAYEQNARKPTKFDK